ncbi:MAG: hypothetical protein EU517_00560 [Promethearchaeota archaeon]|nr:MAG: hypothetical protein EU517_00560 [Candidatus Lokiarchaeota archaeon]
MKRHLVLRYLKLFNVGFCLVSGFEIIFFVVLTFYIPINILSQDYTIFSLLFTSGLSPIHMPLLWILIFAIICVLLVLALLLLIMANNEKIASHTYARILLSIGFFLLVANFIKIEAIYILSKSTVDPSGTPLIFELLLYDPSATPFLGAAFWIYLTASSCVYLISGLVFAAIGLKWMLLLENKELA